MIASRRRGNLINLAVIYRVSMSETIFSKIINKEIPADVVYETDEILAFRDINPQAPTHILVIPKQEIPSLASATETDSPLLGKLLSASAEIAEKEGLKDSGYRVVTNIGSDGGQAVPHLHLHILGGRKMTWPPG